MENLFKLEAAHWYDSVDYSIFEQEFERINIIKKHTKKYYKSGFINERLYLNHIIILGNMFSTFSTNMLFRTTPIEHWPLLITVLLYLNKMPEKIPYTDLHYSQIGIDQNIKERLENL